MRSVSASPSMSITSLRGEAERTKKCLNFRGSSVSIVTRVYSSAGHMRTLTSLAPLAICQGASERRSVPPAADIRRRRSNSMIPKSKQEFPGRGATAP